MSPYGLRFVLAPGPDDDGLDRLSVRFYDEWDGTITTSVGRLIAHVILAADDGRRLEAALDLAVTLESSLGVEIVEMDLDLVDIPEIAERVRRSRQSVQQLVHHERGPGGFPLPVGAPGGKRMWDWACVADWFRGSLGELAGEERCLPRAELAQIDAWLAVRRASALSA